MSECLKIEFDSYIAENYHRKECHKYYMQPVFEVVSKDPVAHEYILPDYVCPLLKKENEKPQKVEVKKGVCTLKRAREAGENPTLTDAQKKKIREFIEFGKRGAATTSTLWSQITHTAKPQNWKLADNLAYQGVSGSGNSSEQSFWDVVLPQWSIIIHQALSLICQVVQQCPAPIVTANYDARAQLVNILFPSSPDKSEKLTLQRSFLSLYCMFSALNLSFADLFATLKKNLPPEKIDSIAEGLCTTAERMCDSLEEAIIHLILSTNAVPFEEIVRLLGKLPSLFKTFGWPCYLLPGEGAEEYSNDNLSLNDTKVAACPATGVLMEKTVESKLCRDKQFARAIGEGGVTSVLIRAANELQKLDCTNVLSKSGSPFSSLNQELRKTSSYQDSEQNVVQTNITFDALVAQVYSGTFACKGLHFAMLQFKLLFKKLESSSKRTTVSALQGKFERLVESVLSQHYLAEIVDRPISFTGTQRDAFYYFETEFLLQADSLSSIASRSLATLKRLQALDVEGWFAVPAFDMVNLDFTSIGLWMRSSLYACKLSKDSFEALSNTFEQVVDTCIGKYGPSNRFSQRITEIRSQVVFASRAEKLI